MFYNQFHRFSRGFLFLDDLAAYLKTGKSRQGKLLDNNELTRSEKELQFSYCLPDHLKLDMKITDEKVDRNDERRVSEEQCNINMALSHEKDDENECSLLDINKHQDSTANLEAFLQKEGFSKNNNNSQSSPISDSSSKLIKLMKSQNKKSNDKDVKQSRENKYWNPGYNRNSNDVNNTFEDEIDDVISIEADKPFELKIRPVKQNQGTFNYH